MTLFVHTKDALEIYFPYEGDVCRVGEGRERGTGTPMKETSQSEGDY